MLSLKRKKIKIDRPTTFLIAYYYTCFSILTFLIFFWLFISANEGSPNSISRFLHFFEKQEGASREKKKWCFSSYCSLVDKNPFDVLRLQNPFELRDISSPV